MVNCPSCKQEFPAATIWTEVIQAKELENRTNTIGKVIRDTIPSIYRSLAQVVEYYLKLSDVHISKVTSLRLCCAFT